MNNLGPIQQEIIVLLRESGGYKPLSEEWFYASGRDELQENISWASLKESLDRLIARGIVEVDDKERHTLKKYRGYLDK